MYGGAKRLSGKPPALYFSASWQTKYCGLIFFAKGMYFFSALWLFLLICLVIIMIISFSLSSKKAAWLQVPYLVWSLFAIALNCAIAFLN